MGTTTHWGLPWPEGSELIADGDDAIHDLADSLDNALRFTMGTFVSRPTAALAKAGLVYFSTDAGRVDLSDGTNWLPLSPDQSFQPGDLKVSAAAGEPAGWLTCDGREVSRTTYAVLYAALGGASSPHGQGNGTTTFNLPDFRGRAIVGLGTGTGLTARAIGDKFGTEVHPLTAAEGPAHSHTHTFSIVANGAHAHGGATVSGGEHAHGLSGSGYVPGGYSQPTSIPVSAIAGGLPVFTSVNSAVAVVNATDTAGGHNHGIASDGNHGHTLSGSITATSAAVGHNNVQPSNTANILVKT